MVLEELKSLIQSQIKYAPILGEGWKKHSVVGLNTKKGVLNAIVLRKGKYKNIIYTYGEKISFGDPESGENPYQCNFTFDIVYNPTPYDVNNDRKFVKLIGEILMDVIGEGMRKKELEQKQAEAQQGKPNDEASKS